MDDYKKYYFAAVPMAKMIPFGEYVHHQFIAEMIIGEILSNCFSFFFSIKNRLVLREKLQCKSFNWYIENVYPELLKRLPKVHGTSASRFGTIKYQSECFDTYGRPSGSSISLYACHGTGGNQVLNSFSISKSILFKSH